MSIIALVGNKGGAGKTTLALNFAAGLSRNASTVIIDADPQGSSLQWRAIKEDDNFPYVMEGTEDLTHIARQASDDYQHVVIDCPPSVHADQTHAALQVCDLALIPVQPSPVDLWATVHIVRAIEDAQEFNRGMRALLVINQIEARTTLSRLVREALVELELPVADTAIRRRAVFRASALEGKSVYEMGKRGEVAATELDELINEVLTP